MKRHSRGFTLTELLTALVIHSFFILMLGGTFYTLISFGSRSQMAMTARERGQRVISYIDSRVRRTGLGMWGLDSSSAIRDALAPLTSSGRVFDKSDMMFPLMITYKDQDTIDRTKIDGDLTIKYDLTNDDNDKNIFCGNTLILLYAQRETDMTTNAAKLIVEQKGIDIKNYTDAVYNDLMTQLETVDDFWLGFFPARAASLDIYKKYKEEGKTTKEAAELTLTDKYGTNIKEKIKALAGYNVIINYVSGYPLLYKYLYNRSSGSYGEFYYSEFGKGEKKNESAEKYEIGTWGVSRGAGVPFVVDKYDNDSTNKFLVKLTPVSEDVRIPNGDELLYLKVVRLYATEPSRYDKTHGQPLRNLKVQKLNDVKWGTHQSSSEPYQAGILELYAELDTSPDSNGKPKNILSVWVLSTGGRDNMTHERPADWPKTARWVDDYKYFVTYVSKGTWKLNNLQEGFKFN